MGDLEKIRQQSHIMKYIGPLLDAWDGIPNDEKSYMREEYPSFVSATNDKTALARLPVQPCKTEWIEED